MYSHDILEKLLDLFQELFKLALGVCEHSLLILKLLLLYCTTQIPCYGTEGGVVHLFWLWVFLSGYEVKHLQFP